MRSPIVELAVLLLLLIVHFEQFDQLMLFGRFVVDIGYAVVLEYDRSVVDKVVCVIFHLFFGNEKEQKKKNID